MEATTKLLKVLKVPGLKDYHAPSNSDVRKSKKALRKSKRAERRNRRQSKKNAHQTPLCLNGVN
jgi:hypothetical protein